MVMYVKNFVNDWCLDYAVLSSEFCGQIDHGSLHVTGKERRKRKQETSAFTEKLPKTNTQLVDGLKEKGEQREEDMIYRWKFNKRETSLHGKSDCTPQNSLQKLALFVDA